MNRELVPLFALLILALVTLACSPCGLLDGRGEVLTPTSVPTSSPVPTEPPLPTQIPAPTDTPTAPPMSETALGEEYRSDEGGFTLRTIPGYEIDEISGLVNMEAPDADPEFGPAIVLMGGALSESATTEELYDEFTADAQEDVEISEPRQITVGGLPGLISDLSGESEGTKGIGRLVVVAVTPTQQFIMAAIAPSERWDEELAPLFDAVLASVSFFELSAELPSGGAAMGQVTRQWAADATASSEYGNPDWAAIQATGAPDTLVEECADLPTAWASAGSDTVEWIELRYNFPVLPTEVNIVQTHSPDQVVKVELVDLMGTYHQIYTGEPENRWGECPYTLSIPVEDADYQVDAVKITIDQSVIPTTWNEIDAVELVGVPEHPIMEGE